MDKLRLKNLSKELEKIEKEKLKIRASEFCARRDMGFWKKRAEMPINQMMGRLNDLFSLPNRDVTEKENLIDLLNSNDNELDDKIIIACKLSDLKYLKSQAIISRKMKELSKRIDRVEFLKKKLDEVKK